MNQLYRMKMTSLIVLTAISLMASAQSQFTQPTRTYLMHSSGLHLKRGSDGIAKLEDASATKPQQVTFVPVGGGYYVVRADASRSYMALSGEWETHFVTDSTSDNAKWKIERQNDFFVKLRCKANNKYLGTDANTAEAWVFANKDGASPLHYWFFSDNAKQSIPVDTLSYTVRPDDVRQHFEGWGVSLCWWANMCGQWDEAKINTLVNWLVSPSGLNYSLFRYNIGGGDDPEWRHCEEHHMARGMGLRAEMPGFKDFTGDEYHWDRDEAQRRIMLKIREKCSDAVFEAFSNSAPYYMTYSGCVSGNTDPAKDNLRPEYYEEFAHYLVDVCKHYKDEYGIEFRTLEPFNEAMTDFWRCSGTQEGCHFDVQSQINFLRVLAPILQASGLSTVISASDETKVAQSVADFNAYKSAGVLPLVSQWNTHTYSVTNADRKRLAQLAQKAGIPLWMSEVGAGGSGLGGNLALAQKLFDDIRYLQPEAWIDWQVMEEDNDQWCTVTGNFANQTFSRNKNYYVRQQCSRFIPSGYDIIASDCDQSLAAINAAQDTLVLVVLNEGTKAIHRIDLSHFAEVPAKAKVKAYRTSASEDLKRIYDFTVSDKMMTITLPTQSITTLLLPVGSKETGIRSMLGETEQSAKNTPKTIYSINGCRIGNSTKGLPPGLYIVRQGNTSRKIIIKN